MGDPNASPAIGDDNMTDPVDQVRALMDQAEEVDMPEGMDRPEDDGMDMPPAPPPADPEGPPPPEQDCAAYPLNDFGNAQRFVRHFGDDVMFVPRVGWFVWVGTHWQLDDDLIEVRAKAQALAEKIALETWYIGPSPSERDILTAGDLAEQERDAIEAKTPSERSEDEVARLPGLRRQVKDRDRLQKRLSNAVSRRLTHARNAGNSNAIKNLIAESEVLLAKPLDCLDARPLDVNCLSGVLRFSVVDCRAEGGGKVAQVDLIPHARDQYMTKIMPVHYDRDAPSARFDAFMAEIQPIADMRRFLARWFGLSTTALTGEQKFAFFHGNGANGKSVLVDLMMRLLGDYSAPAKIETLTGTNRRGGGDATPDLMQLFGARMVSASEPDEGMRLQEGLIKELTGGEKFLARALHTNFIEFYPQFKLTISGNHKPEIHGGDDGIWRRVMLVDFPVQIPAERRRPKSEMDAMLWEERDGIFRWLVDGLLDYLESGLQVPQAVADATQEYREDSDLYGTFLTLCCHVSGDHRDTIPARDIVQAFNFWLDDQGKGTHRDGTVSKRFSALAGRWKSPVTQRTFEKHKASTMSYKGIRFNDVFGPRFRDMPRDQKGNILRGGQSTPSQGGGAE